MTDSSRRRRRLAAILMADVVGFSRLMGRDEEGTTSRIVAFHGLVRESVEGHGGRVVGTAGDSVFGDFDSIVAALECAVEIQRRLHAENDGRTSDERIDARIGLHLGDVIVEGDDVYGDGVNVAARLEQLADPGGITMSEAVYHLVRGRTDLPIEKVGVKRLKNIEDPIEIHRIPPSVFGGEAQPPAVSDPRSHAEDRIRTAAERIVEKAASGIEGFADRLESGEFVVDASGRIKKAKVVAPIRAGTFVLISLGVLGLLARVTGWTENAWYPFLGSWLFGIGAGGVVERLTKADGLGMILHGASLVAGAFFFDNVVARVVFWVIAAAIVGGGLSALRKWDRK